MIKLNPLIEIYTDSVKSYGDVKQTFIESDNQKVDFILKQIFPEKQYVIRDVLESNYRLAIDYAIELDHANMNSCFSRAEDAVCDARIIKPSIDENINHILSTTKSISDDISNVYNSLSCLLTLKDFLALEYINESLFDLSEKDGVHNIKYQQQGLLEKMLSLPLDFRKSFENDIYLKLINKEESPLVKKSLSKQHYKFINNLDNNTIKNYDAKKHK